MENQNLNQENENQENQTNNQDPNPPPPPQKKKKEPKKSSSWKKGAEARWKRMQGQQVPTDQQEAPVEQETVTRVTREPQETESTFKVNFYKNYIPLCAVLMVVGIGIYMSYNKPVSIQAKEVTQPPPQQSTPDPFEMN